MFIILFLIAAIFLFLKITDSSFNLWFWIRFGRTKEDDYYRDKAVWIVGASSGIGEDIAMRLAKHTRALVISARRKDELERVKARCNEVNRTCKIEVLPMDILKYDELQAKVAAADQICGVKIDIVILNAGRSQRAEWTDIDPSVDLDCFQINAVAPTQVARCMLNHRGLHPTSLKKDALQFVVVSSVAGLVPAVLSASYGAAKAALNQYFRLLAVEMGERGVLVSIVNPSLVFAPNNPLTAFTSAQGTAHGEVISRPSASHMASQRAAELISLATVHQISESIISASPAVLLLTYLNTVAPGITLKFLLLGGVERLRKLRKGEN